MADVTGTHEQTVTELPHLLNPTDEEVVRYREMPYEDFLQTEYWAAIRGHVIDKIGKCQVCTSRESLNVHHNTYEHRGQEYLHLEDLVVLCNRCHGCFHALRRLGDNVPAQYQQASFDNFTLPRDNPMVHRELAHALAVPRTGTSRALGRRKAGCRGGPI